MDRGALHRPLVRTDLVVASTNGGSPHGCVFTLLHTRYAAKEIQFGDDVGQTLPQIPLIDLGAIGTTYAQGSHVSAWQASWDVA